MEEDFFFKKIIKKYNNYSEIEFLKKMAPAGLEDYEEIIIDKYCKKEGHTLVIGCGAGRESFALSEKKLNVTGIDIVEKLASICHNEGKEKNIKANFLTMNGFCLGFKKESFDYIILFGQLISLIPSRENRINTLKECKRVLKDNGLIIFTTHSRERNLKEKLKWKIINFVRKINSGKLQEGDKWVTAISGYNLSEEKIFMHMYTPQEALKDIKLSGLRMIEYRSATEIVNNINCPSIRESDKYIIYIAKKMSEV
jgi:2-polyprenyl-3-methyl-5-hydroxy-6-metoxy-1,4-benzoquinol methylase